MTHNYFLAMLQRRRIVLAVTFILALIALPFVLRLIRPTYVGVAHVMMVGKDSMIPSSDMGTLTLSGAVIDRVAKRSHLVMPIRCDRASMRSRVFIPM